MIFQINPQKNEVGRLLDSYFLEYLMVKSSKNCQGFFHFTLKVIILDDYFSLMFILVGYSRIQIAL